jgi:hypothetical protein
MPYPAIITKKILGYGVGFGEVAFGYSLFGDDMEVAGVYRYGGGRRPRSVDRMVHYAPTNPQSVEQQANRSTFADAVSEWQGLTAEERLEYNDRAKRISRHGYNLFISEYLKAN